METLSMASGSSDSCSSQWRKEILSSSAARGCSHGAAASISAVSSSILAIRRSISRSVFSATGKSRPS